MSSAGITCNSAALSEGLAFPVVRCCMSLYALALWTSALVPPSFDPLPSGPALPSFLPACDGQLQQDLSDGAGWFLPHVRIINVRVVESYPASRRAVVLLSLPRNPCSARRSLDAFLRAPTANTQRVRSYAARNRPCHCRRGGEAPVPWPVDPPRPTSTL